MKKKVEGALDKNVELFEEDGFWKVRITGFDDREDLNSYIPGHKGAGNHRDLGDHQQGGNTGLQDHEGGFPGQDKRDRYRTGRTCQYHRHHNPAWCLQPGEESIINRLTGCLPLPRNW